MTQLAIPRSRYRIAAFPMAGLAVQRPAAQSSLFNQQIRSVNTFTRPERVCWLQEIEPVDRRYPPDPRACLQALCRRSACKKNGWLVACSSSPKPGSLVAMSSGQATVYIVDDEIQIRTAIGHLCEETGHQAKLFASTEEFLAESISEGPSCLVLDVRFPGLSPTGLELQSRLAEAGVSIPIVFISGHPDVRVSVEAMKRGAVEFLPKPFREQEILDAIRHGIERDRRRMAREDTTREARQRVEALTAREREIMLLMAEGLVAKQIAARLGVSEVTAKVHRARMMRKLGLRSPIEVVRLIDSIGREGEATRAGAG
jgi:FixJ family two-component response regulator